MSEKAMTADEAIVKADTALVLLKSGASHEVRKATAELMALVGENQVVGQGHPLRAEFDGVKAFASRSNDLSGEKALSELDSIVRERPIPEDSRYLIAIERVTDPHLKFGSKETQALATALAECGAQQVAGVVESEVPKSKAREMETAVVQEHLKRASPEVKALADGLVRDGQPSQHRQRDYMAAIGFAREIGDRHGEAAVAGLLNLNDIPESVRKSASKPHDLTPERTGELAAYMSRRAPGLAADVTRASTWGEERKEQKELAKTAGYEKDDISW